MLDYRGKMQLTTIIYSKKSPKHGIKCSSQQSFIQKKPKTRDKMQFTTIIYSKKAQNTG
jgi:hypothetical protein